MAKTKSRNEARKRRHLRVRTKVRGTAERPRLSIFRSLDEIYVQAIDDDSGLTIVSASTIDNELRPKMEGLNKTKQAQLVGKTIAERLKKKKIDMVIFDRGGYQYTGRVKALAEAAREGGLNF